jgi:hypothetical protein
MKNIKYELNIRPGFQMQRKLTQMADSWKEYYYK